MILQLSIYIVTVILALSISIAKADTYSTDFLKQAKELGIDGIINGGDTVDNMSNLPDSSQAYASKQAAPVKQVKEPVAAEQIDEDKPAQQSSSESTQVTHNIISTTDKIQDKINSQEEGGEHYFSKQQAPSVVDQKYQSRRKNYDYTRKIPAQDKGLIGGDHSQQDKSYYLFEAVRTKDIGVVKSLLAAGADINTHDQKNGYTPLMYAIQENNIDAAKYLLHKGVNPVVTTANGMNVLHLAAILQNTAAIEFLLKTNVNFHARDINGKCFYDYINRRELPIVVNQIYSQQDSADKALLFFSRIGMKEGVMFSLQKQANVNCKDDITGDTALINAVRNNDKELSILLLRFGSDISAKNKRKNDALDIAEQNNLTNMVALLKTVHFNKHLFILGYADKIIPYKLNVNEVGQIQKDLNLKNLYNFGEYPSQEILGLIDDN